MEFATSSDAATLASFALTSLIIELTPGPNMTYLALVSAGEGRRAGFATVAGIALGLAVLGIVAALGVTELIQASNLLYEGLRWAGVLFLLFLAYEGWRGAAEVVATDKDADRRYFMRGLVTNLLNPKAAVFYVAVLPTFIVAERPVLSQTITLTAIYVAVATVIHALIVTLAGTLEPFLNDSRRERIARRALSALLAAVAIWFALSTAR
ncbi:threonine/homoserine/homoserine lactone efflux protein [Aminobacter niigataensis]|uniref:Threonine/homoserine/homoserine lactone efflux protein n=1 Tax=Aminobacter niigataensis TaxID=83265 RepID=A0ABR6L2R8_9HYPH|nr:LysE family translocator [Aminobacter niigataensis]MBB4651094.1 threonine/homoserine/homoserine lactone efflux protein [Aminobacter niigataensis]